LTSNSTGLPFIRGPLTISGEAAAYSFLRAAVNRRILKLIRFYKVPATSFKRVRVATLPQFAALTEVGAVKAAIAAG